MKAFYRFAVAAWALSFAQKCYADYQLVWSDEFNYQGLPDPSKWEYDAWNPKTINDELQKYTSFRPENTRVENGHLTIEARRDWFNGFEFTSGRIVTRNTFSFNQGRIEVRAKLPWGRGTFPAIFLLPQNNSLGSWPDSGEIDIVEHVGFHMDWIRSSIQCQAYNFQKKQADKNAEEKNVDYYVNGVANDFHVYKMEWNNDRIAISVDDQPPHFTYANDRQGIASWPFNQNFYLILNQAVGGNWGGMKGIDYSVYPQTMQVDYVRVYQWR